MCSDTTIAESYTNVATPGTYNAAPGTAPAWAAATGWTFNGLTHYLTTGVTPQQAQTQSMLVCFTATTSNRHMCGSLGAAGGNSRFYLVCNTVTAIYGNGGFGIGTPAMSGCLAVCGDTGYKNGISDATGLAAWTSAPRAIYLGAQNSGTPANYFGGVITLVAVWSSNIAAYIASLYTVLQTAGLTV